MIAVTILRNGPTQGPAGGLKRPVLDSGKPVPSVKSPAVCEGTHAGRSSAHGIAAIRLMAVRGSSSRSTPDGRRAHDRSAATDDGKSPQYEVIKDGKIVGRIALFHALRDRRKPWVWSIDLAFSAGHERVHGFAETRYDAMQAFARSWYGIGVG